MTLTIASVLLLLSIICFVLSAFAVPARVSWADLGRAFFVAAVLAGLGR